MGGAQNELKGTEGVQSTDEQRLYESDHVITLRIQSKTRNKISHSSSQLLLAGYTLILIAANLHEERLHLPQRPYRMCAV
jgi:hypothetical protein